MRTLAIVIVICVTCLLVATERTWSNYTLSKRQLDIRELELRIDIIKMIRANPPLPNPAPQKPSLEIRPSFTPEKLSFPRSRVQDSGRNGPLPETAQRQPRPPWFLPANADRLPAGKDFLLYADTLTRYTS